MAIIRFTIILLGIILVTLSQPVCAQSTQQTFVLGNGTNIQILPDQKIMFDAANKFVHRDFQGAEKLYSQVIAMNSGNIEAYLQRAAVRREMGNETGTASDAHSVIALSNNALQQNPNNPNLYYQRGMGFRLLRQFDQAKSDISTGMQIGGKTNWNTDLQAIDLERKIIVR